MKKARILIVEDDKHIAKLLSYNLEKADYSVTAVTSGESALLALSKTRPDLIILDIMLPEMDGYEVCKKIRAMDEHCSIPIVMLTAKSEEVDRVLGFELGADDYVIKPFSPRELLARVKAVLRRSAEKGPVAKMIKLGSLTVDFDKIVITVGKKVIELTSKEFELLCALLKAKGRVLSRDFLLDSIWGFEQAADIQTRTVDVHVASLRRKLKAEGKRIITVKNYGYRFITD